MWMIIITRTIVASIAAVIVTRIIFRFQDIRLEREIAKMHKQTDELIDAAFAPIRKLDSQQW